MCIIFSDSVSNIYSISDTVQYKATGRAKCILKTNSGYEISSMGKIVFNNTINTGTFSISTTNSALEKGILIVDSITKNPIEDFTKITGKNVFGQQLSALDSADWKIRTNWNLAERMVFNLCEENTEKGNQTLVTFPNPMSDLFQCIINNYDQLMLDVVLVNSNMEIIYYLKDIEYNSSLAIDVSVLENSYYRMYYCLKINSQLFYGSGDIKKQNQEK